MFTLPKIINFKIFMWVWYTCTCKPLLACDKIYRRPLFNVQYLQWMYHLWSVIIKWHIKQAILFSGFKTLLALLPSHLRSFWPQPQGKDWRGWPPVSGTSGGPVNRGWPRIGPPGGPPYYHAGLAGQGWHQSTAVCPLYRPAGSALPGAVESESRKQIRIMV